MKQCCKCKQIKLTEMFEIDRRKSQGRGSRCKNCLHKVIRVQQLKESMKKIAAKIVMDKNKLINQRVKAELNYARESLRCVKCGMIGSELCYGCDGSGIEFEESAYQSPGYMQL